MIFIIINNKLNIFKKNRYLDQSVPKKIFKK